MKWSWRIGRVAGIGLYIHWTFLLLLAWVVGMDLMNGQGWEAAAAVVLFIVAIFACVMLHELGHALVAMRYHVRTRDITLLPIGGMARLERIPRDPTQEFWIAVAGPAVNVLIAGVLFGVLYVMGQIGQIEITSLAAGHFLARLIWVNIVLVLFNMIPAFPMDGGRVLRSLLARRFSYGRATQIAAGIGQAIAILFAIVGLFTNPFLLFIAMFVYIGAQSETHMAQLSELMNGIPVRDAMITRFHTLSPENSMSSAAEEMLPGWQHDFPIVAGDRLVGMLMGSDIVRALQSDDSSATVADYMRTECHEVNDTTMLEDSIYQMQAAGCSTLPVVNDGRLVGMLSGDQLGHWLSVHSRPSAASLELESRTQADQPRHTPSMPSHV